MQAELTLYYAPRTRSRTAVWMLEELGVAYAMESFPIHLGRQRQPEYLALNPMGKVPVLVDRGRPVAELGAMAIYLGDRFADRELAPTIDAAERADYLRWCFFASAIMEPCMAERLFQWEIPSGSVAWGSFSRMERALVAGLDQAEGDWLLGQRFSLADCLVGAMLQFGSHFGALDIGDRPTLGAYLERLAAREAFQRALEIEARESERLPAG